MLLIQIHILPVNRFSSQINQAQRRELFGPCQGAAEAAEKRWDGMVHGDFFLDQPFS